MSMNALMPVLQHQLQMLYSLPVWPIYIWHGWIGKPSLKLPIPAEHACNTPILRHSLGFGAFVDPADLVIEVLVQVLRQLIQQGTWEQNNPLCLSCLNILLWFGKEAPTVSAASVTTALGNTVCCCSRSKQESWCFGRWVITSRKQKALPAPFHLLQWPDWLNHSH